MGIPMTLPNDLSNILEGRLSQPDTDGRLCWCTMKHVSLSETHSTVKSILNLTGDGNLFTEGSNRISPDFYHETLNLYAKN